MEETAAEREVNQILEGIFAEQGLTYGGDNPQYAWRMYQLRQYLASYLVPLLEPLVRFVLRSPLTADQLAAEIYRLYPHTQADLVHARRIAGNHPRDLLAEYIHNLVTSLLYHSQIPSLLDYYFTLRRSTVASGLPPPPRVVLDLVAYQPMSGGGKVIKHAYLSAEQVAGVFAYNLLTYAYSLQVDNTRVSLLEETVVLERFTQRSPESRYLLVVTDGRVTTNYYPSSIEFVQGFVNAAMWRGDNFRRYWRTFTLL